MYTSRAMVAVAEELPQLDHSFKLLVKVHQKCHQSLDRDKLESEEWFEKRDETLFRFKNCLDGWLKMQSPLKNISTIPAEFQWNSTGIMENDWKMTGTNGTYGIPLKFR